MAQSDCPGAYLGDPILKEQPEGACSALEFWMGRALLLYEALIAKYGYGAQETNEVMKSDHLYTH